MVDVISYLYDNEWICNLFVYKLTPFTILGAKAIKICEQTVM